MQSFNRDFSFVINKDGKSVTIEKYLKYEKVVYVPQSIVGEDENSYTVNKIGDNAFSYCHSLLEVKLPNGIISIGDGAFGTCGNLEKISLPDTLTSIGKNAFYSCESLKKISLPDNLTSIGISAFSFCESLEEISFPDNLTSIGLEAFRFCKSLEEISLPDTLTSIGERAFSDCKRLKKILLPESLTFIGKRAFKNCKNLKAVYFKGNVPENWGEGVFDLTSLGLIIYYRNDKKGWTMPRWTDPEGILRHTVPYNSVFLAPYVKQLHHIGSFLEFWS